MHIIAGYTSALFSQHVPSDATDRCRSQLPSGEDYKLLQAEEAKRFKYLIRGGVPRYAVTQRETAGEQLSRFGALAMFVPVLSGSYYLHRK